jgi:Ca-activated chloride channel family protein
MHMNRGSLASAVAVAIGLATAGHASPLAQEPTFKAGNRTVAVYATVAGADGRLIPDLPRDAFTVTDNGKVQPLTLFASEIQPITVVMLLDRSTSMRANFTVVEKAAEAFVAAMLPADKARIGSFSNRIQIDPREFTASHDELLEILRRELQEEGPTPLWNAVNVGITDLLHQQGRRVVLVFTDGADRPLTFSANNSSLKDVMKRADEEDVMVYAIGLAGHEGGGGFRPSGGGSGRGGHRGGMGRGRGGSMRGGAGDKPDEGLPKIATATGGGYFELTSTSDMAATFSRIADELHHQYAIGFSPELLDGKMHRLDVSVAASSVTVRARRSYLARNER